MSKVVLQTKDLMLGYGRVPLNSSPLNLSFSEPAMIALTGPNGCGKSSLLHTLLGLLKPFAGNVLLNGKSLRDIPHSERARQISFVASRRPDDTRLTVQEVVSVGRYLHTGIMGTLSENDKTIVSGSLERVGMLSYVKQPLMELSDGEVQRVMIARALAQQTPLILMDEPTSHLDAGARIECMTMIRKLAGEEQKTVFFSTHDIGLSLHLSDQIYVMTRNRMTIGSPEDIILNKTFEQVFPGTNLFLPELIHTQAGPGFPCSVSGNCPMTELTKRALFRYGFITGSNKSTLFDVIIGVNDSGPFWTLKSSAESRDFQSLGDLIGYVKLKYTRNYA